MRLYDNTNCEWAKKLAGASQLDMKGLEMTILDVLNHVSECNGEDEDTYKVCNYQLVDSLVVYRSGRVDILDGHNDVITLYTEEFGEIYLSWAYKCESGQAILVCYRTLEDAGECENEMLITC